MNFNQFHVNVLKMKCSFANRRWTRCIQWQRIWNSDVKKPHWRKRVEPTFSSCSGHVSCAAGRLFWLWEPWGPTAAAGRGVKGGKRRQKRRSNSGRRRSFKQRHFETRQSVRDTALVLQLAARSDAFFQQLDSDNQFLLLFILSRHPSKQQKQN